MYMYCLIKLLLTKGVYILHNNVKFFSFLKLYRHHIAKVEIDRLPLLLLIPFLRYFVEKEAEEKKH